MAADTPQHRYDAKFANTIEPLWQARWEDANAYRTPNPGEPGFDGSRPKFYCLDMFPYPSGAGLHVGHPEGYTATDIICRYKRARGFNVLHPMGYDAFGLPAEQYAIQTGVHPAVTTKKSIENFRRQLKRFGFSYDWSREFATIDPEYYKWTQWVFLRLFNAWVDPRTGRARHIDELSRELDEGRGPAGAPDSAAWRAMDAAAKRTVIDGYRLAYRAEATVNWCPKLGTVLANDEVIDGRSERGGHPVVRKPLKQWMFRITAMAERLLNDLNLVEWPASTKTMQQEWIGRSEGAEVEFEVVGGSPLRVFTTRPDTIFGATYMVVAPEHPLVAAALAKPGPRTDAARLRAYAEAARNRSDIDRQADSKVKTGVDTGLDAINPATGKAIPIWTADYVLMGYGTGAIMAVPAQDERDWAFAEAFGLAVIRTVQPPEGFEGGAFTGDGPAINSGFLNGLGVAEAKAKAIEWVESKGIGRRRVNYKLRDWAFSRQRYWGEPFPIVYDEQGNAHAVGEKSLPVVLPELADYSPAESDEPQPLLAKAASWVNTTAGAAGVEGLPANTPVRRETNTMPGSAGSSWYYLRYCDAKNGQRFVSREAEGYWMVSKKASGGTHAGGVDLYVGGSEHAVGHLLYSRFWHKVLFDLGEVSTPEPFGRLFHQGLITSFAFQRPDKTLCPNDQVTEQTEGVYVETSTGARLTPVVAKMSKSLKNVVNPDDVIAEYGADTFRLYEMYMGPLEASKPWNPRDIVGMYRFLQKLWRVVIDEDTGAARLAESPDAGNEKRLHRLIAKAGADVETLSFNTAIAAMIQFVNDASPGSLTK
ncbi:MAG: leucine--tRNA ligase, partial [Planctomycetes bacterium]|nr:leucine--tRNA ligase [Planctomycetota bacterium]